MTSWLTLSEYLAVEGISRRTFYNRRHLIDAQTIDGTLKYSAASLSIEARAKLKSQSEPVATSNSAAHGPLFTAVNSAPLALRNTPPQRITLTADAQRQAEARLEILRPLLDFINDPKNRGRFAMLRVSDGRPITSSDLMATYLSETHTDGGKKISPRTLWRWKKAYTEQGLVGLARSVRADKGTSRWFSQHVQAAKLVASVYLKPYQTVQTAYNALLRDSQMLGLHDDDLPSYETVRSYLETIPKPIQVLAREGERVHNERMSLYLQRDYSMIEPNFMWVSDHMIHDVEVRNDCFHGIEPNAPMRLRFTCLMDMASRKIVGYSWTPEGNSRSISTALRRAVEQYGPCDTFYCDNGKDYQKVARGADPAVARLEEDRRSGWFRDDVAEIEKAGVLQRLGMKVQFCIKYHPQSKPIERMFRTMHLQLDAKMPHYTTGNAYLKPDYTVIAMAEHRKLLRMDRGHESPLVPASHFIRMATVWIEEEYNAKHSHSGKGMAGRTPNEVFDAGYPAEMRRTVDPDVLAQLLWSREKRRVRECAVTLSGRRYMAASASDSAAMYLRNEQDVLICFDPHDLDRAIVADLDGHKIADVQAERLMSHSAADGPAIAASMQERKRLRNASASTVRSLRSDVAMAGHRSDVELLHERALLPAAVGDFITQRHPQTVESTTAQTQHLHSEDIGDILLDSLSRRTANGTHG